MLILNVHLIKKKKNYTFFSPGPASELSPAIEEEESKGGLEVMPNISDILLRKLRVHKSLPGR